MKTRRRTESRRQVERRRTGLRLSVVHGWDFEHRHGRQRQTGARKSSGPGRKRSSRIQRSRRPYDVRKRDKRDGVRKVSNKRSKHSVRRTTSGVFDPGPLSFGRRDFDRTPIPIRSDRPIAIRRNTTRRRAFRRFTRFKFFHLFTHGIRGIPTRKPTKAEKTQPDRNVRLRAAIPPTA